MLLIGRINETECQTVLDKTKDFLNILKDSSEKYLTFTPSFDNEEDYVIENMNEEKNSIFFHEKHAPRRDKYKKKNMASKILQQKLSRKFMIIGNGTLLLIVCLFYIPILNYHSELDAKMDISISTNIQLSNYIESVDLAFALELLLINEVFFNGYVLSNQSFTVIKILDDIEFYKENYIYNLQKMDTFLNDLNYFISNPELDANTQANLKSFFFEDTCSEIVENACQEQLVSQ